MSSEFFDFYWFLRHRNFDVAFVDEKTRTGEEQTLSTMSYMSNNNITRVPICTRDKVVT